MTWTFGRADAIRLAWLVVAASALAGCAGDGQAPADVATDGQPAAARPIEPELTARLMPPGEPTPVPKLDLPRRAAPPPKPPPIELVGMIGDRVVGVLGRPHHIWREPPAAVWQYRATECVLHVFFYTAAGNGAQVVHVTRRKPGSAEPLANGVQQPVAPELSDKLCRRVELAE